MMYHYTYRITNIVEKKYYYGVHSCNCLPQEDIGVKYWSSSTIPEFIQDQKETPQNYKYKVIKIFETRKEALEHEIFLHAKFDVGVNKKFYNGSKQISTRFDTTGKVTVKNLLTDETELICCNDYYLNKHIYNSILSNKIVCKLYGEEKYMLLDSAEYNNKLHITPSTGKITVFDQNTNKYKKISESNYYDNKENYTTILSNRVAVLDNTTNKWKLLETDEYHNNKERYSTHTQNKVAVTDGFNNFLINKDDLKHNNNLYPIAKNKVNAIDIRTGQMKQYTKEEYDSSENLRGVAYNTVTAKLKGTETFTAIPRGEYITNKDNYESTLSNKIRVVDINIPECKPFYILKSVYESSENLIHINNNGKKIFIYNKNDDIILKTHSNFKNICIENNLPLSALLKSYRNNGQKLSKKYKEFEGFYALEQN